MEIIYGIIILILLLTIALQVTMPTCKPPLIQI